MTAMAEDRRDESQNGAVLLVICVIAALISVTATAMSKDPLFQFQGYIFTAAFTLGSFALLAAIASGVTVSVTVAVEVCPDASVTV